MIIIYIYILHTYYTLQPPRPLQLQRLKRCRMYDRGPGLRHAGRQGHVRPEPSIT